MRAVLIELPSLQNQSFYYLSPSYPLPLSSSTTSTANLEKEFDYREEHFDFIQQHIRHFCLHFGAALVYTSVKEDKNCDLFLKYAEHRLYGFPFLNQVIWLFESRYFFDLSGIVGVGKVRLDSDASERLSPFSPILFVSGVGGRERRRVHSNRLGQ